MFKLRGSGRSQQVEAGAEAPAAELATDNKQPKKVFTPRKFIILGVILLAIVAGGAVVVFMNRDDDTVYTAEKSALKEDYKALKEQPVSTQASKEDQAEYYDQLRYSSAQNEDYKAAVAAFKKREAITDVKLGYRDYVEAATYYYRAGDKEDALAALETAKSKLPKTDNLEGDYSYEGELAFIESIKAEYSK